MTTLKERRDALIELIGFKVIASQPPEAPRPKLRPPGPGERLVWRERHPKPKPRELTDIEKLHLSRHMQREGATREDADRATGAGAAVRRIVGDVLQRIGLTP